MATVDDLLRALHRQAVHLHHAGSPGRQLPAHLRGWAPLATNTLRVLEALDPFPQDRELYGLLRRLAASQGVRPGRPDGGMQRLALIVGALGDVVLPAPETVAHAGQTQRSRLQASLQAALHAAARVTVDIAQNADQTQVADTVRKVAEATELAALLPPSARVSTLERLAVPRLSPGTLDGAVQVWAGVARRTFSDGWLVTGVALQEAAATLALVCQTTADTLHEAARRRVLDPDTAREAARLADAASIGWRAAAAWPTSVQLGGRAYEHHQAVRTVRQALTGPPLARLTLRERTRTLRTAISACLKIGDAQAEAVTRLAREGGLWVARERVNLRPPGVQRHKIRLDWEPIWPGHPAGRVLIDQAQAAHQQLAAAAAVIDQAVLPGAPQRGEAGRIALVDSRIVADWWETVTPTPGTRTRPSVPGPAPSHQGISR